LIFHHSPFILLHSRNAASAEQGAKYLAQVVIVLHAALARKILSILTSVRVV
jgi:hypothetical protein